MRAPEEKSKDAPSLRDPGPAAEGFLQRAFGENRAKIIGFFAFLLVCGALGAIFGIRYEGNDDAFINLLAVGAFGPQSQYLVHMNTAYGFLLKGLFALFPSVNWYLLIMLLANLAGVFILADLAAEKLSRFFFSAEKPGRLLYFTVLISVSLCLLQDYLFFPQYTKSGMLCSAAGLLLLLSYLFPELAWGSSAARPAVADRMPLAGLCPPSGKKEGRDTSDCAQPASGKRSVLITGTLFSALGLCFRLKCFLFLLPFFGLGLLFGLAGRKDFSGEASEGQPSGTGGSYQPAPAVKSEENPEKRPSETAGRLKPALSAKPGAKLTGRLAALGKALALPALLLILLTLFDHYAYASDPAWAAFRRFNTLREDVMDYNSLSFEAHEDAYRQAGITPEELVLLSSWNYGDTERFTADRLSVIKDILYADNAHGLSFGPWVFRVIPGDLADKLSTNAPAVLTALGLLVLIVFGRGRTRLFAAGAAFILLGEVWYLSCMGRVEWRAEIGAWLGALFFSIWASDRPTGEGKGEKSASRAGYLVISLFFLAGSWSMARLKLTADSSVIPKTTQSFFAQKPSGRFCLGGSSAFLMDAYPETDPFRITGDCAGYFREFCFLGGWMIPSPSALYYAGEAGFSNPMKAVLEEGVLFAGMEEEAQELAAYFRAVYGIEISYAPAGEAGGIALWSFSLQF